MVILSFNERVSNFVFQNSFLKFPGSLPNVLFVSQSHETGLNGICFSFRKKIACKTTCRRRTAEHLAKTTFFSSSTFIKLIL